ncbi:hypothetical protein KW837_10335 [Pseudomonas sp. PDM24]|uniref:hypothetical protein n=1 Tax=Pseudomonas sp. PDM24 TaxID=2854777 RepID=UPI001C4755EE|nr:hypothetical protein [Pseudomonas sp. PDM24]MBV7494663.1 hypothetical protein [Pseudomonas sp. PDM24]
MNSRIVIGFLIHFLACAFYIVMNNYAVPIYKEMVGGLTSRGVAIGMGMYVIFYFFVFCNFIIVFVKKMPVKIGMAVFMVSAILYYMLPQYPVRGMAYSALSGSLTFIAIAMSSLLVRVWTKFFQKRESL